MAELPKDPVDTYGLEVLRKVAEEDPTKTTKYRFRTTSTGSFSPSGLQTGFRHTDVTIDSTSWTPLPATALTDRNSIFLRNRSGIEIKINSDITDALPAGYVGTAIEADETYSVDLADEVIIYAKAASGTPTIEVTEYA